jgi:gliding motility-associated-like protein
MKRLKFYFGLLGVCLSPNYVLSQAQAGFTIQSNIIPQSCNFGKIQLTVNGDEAPYSYVWSDGSNNVNLNNAVAGEHAVTIFGSNGNDTTLYFTVPLEKCKVSFPLIFTPNDDGINDTWNLANIDKYPNSTIQIFDRWGNRVFSSNGEYIPWDGKNLGANLPSATYYFVFYYKGNEGDMEKGAVSILR